MPDVRLTAVADRLRPGRRLADIGSDHAYLPIFAVSRGSCPSAIATDVRPGPAACARRHIARAGLSDKIEVRLGDGLSVVGRAEAEDWVIAGMGGEQIAAILERSPFAFDTEQMWVFQPMSRPEALRQFLLTHGFSLGEDAVIPSGNRLYSLIRAQYTGAPAVTAPVRWWIGAVSAQGNDLYWEKLTDRLAQCGRGARLRGDTAETIAEWTEWETRVREYWQGGGSDGYRG